MKLLNVRFNAKQLTKMINDTAQYGKGFTKGIEIEKIFFMTELGKFTEKAFNEYIDSQAKANPGALHHVYEWGQIGNPGGRLFEIESIPGPQVIKFSGRFLASDSTSDTATEPFIYKAETMERGISITVTPRLSNYLKFDVENETVFTPNSVVIDEPGGPGVAGSFKRAADTFFLSYFNGVLLQTFLRELATAEEFVQYFPQGAKGGGFSVGIKAGRLYLSSAGMKMI
jgi:hypothetical protein